MPQTIPKRENSFSSDSSSYNSHYKKKGTSPVTTGRKSKKVKKIEPTALLDIGTVMHREIILKKVNTAVINRKRTTYFKCPNMRTPTHVVGVCTFSGKIVEFPTNLNMEILHDHSVNCSYIKGNKQGNKDLKSINSGGMKINKGNSQTKQTLLNKQSGVQIKNTDFLPPDMEGIELTNMRIDLLTEEDYNKIAEVGEMFKFMEENLIN